MSNVPQIRIGSDGEIEFPLYAYVVNSAATLSISGVFALFSLIHLYQAWRYKSWRYTWPFTLGVITESVGYGIRHVSGQQPYELGLYIASQLMLILAPVAMAATCYITFGKLIALVNPKYSYVRPSRVTWTFLGFDILSFVVQGAGGALFAGKRSLFKAAKAILTCGFLIQIVAFGVFVIFAIIYQVRARKNGIPKGPWTRLLWTLYGIAACILVRSIFRTIEFGTGEGVREGYLITNEWCFYAFEAGPILAASLLTIFSNPGHYFQQPLVEGGRIGNNGLLEQDEAITNSSTTKVDGNSTPTQMRQV